MKNCSIEAFFKELNLSRNKWLLCCTYNVHRNFISDHVSNTGKNLDLFSANYDHIFLMGDFNAEFQNHFLKGCVRYIFASLFLSLNKSTCQTGENVFYFTSKALFVLEIIKFENSAFSNFMTSSNA